ncbi:transposase [Patescibacteria group bacterium]|nr:transposase [Patescibacteria group bacterium]MBU1891087.1 transposase [Patescibacteria group bacterium]
MTQRRIYQDEYPYFVTFRTKDGYPFFNDSKYTRLLSRIIFKTCEIKCYEVLSYQIMPDHVHLFVNSIKKASATAESCARGRIKNDPAQVSAPALGDSEGYIISQLMYTIKSYFLCELRKECNIPYSIWQKRFHTRIVDADEYLESIVMYIKQNPIKADLQSKYHKMPYQYFDWNIIETIF